MKKWAMICIAYFLLFSISACSKHETGEQEIIRFGLETAPVNLDPRYATDAISERICRLIYQPLVDFDEESKPVAKLAKWKRISSLHYRFRLHPDRNYFHNGEQLVAHDVKATFNSILTDNKLSPHRGAIKHIKEIHVIDDETIDFILSQSDVLFPGRLNIGILPQSLIEKKYNFHENPLGNGPAIFISWPQPGKLILQRKHDKKLLEFITIKDSTIRVIKLARGEIDLLQGNLSAELVQWLSEHESIRVEKSRGSIYSYLGFNLNDPLLKDIRIRKAIGFAIDREKIIKMLFAHRARLAGSLLVPEHWAGHPTLEGLPYDPQRSKQLLNEVGYSETHPLQLTYKTSNNPFRLRLATIIQFYLKQVGIHINIQSYDWGTFYGDIKKGKFQIYSLSWVGLNLPDIFRYIFHSDSVPPNGANRGYFFDQQLDQMIDTVLTNHNKAAQIRNYHSIQQYIHEKLPYVSLWYEDNVLAIRNDLQGYQLNTLGHYDTMMTIQRKQTHD